jgi:hypothetical protein
MENAKNLKAPAVRDLKASELITLRNLGGAMAEEALGPDWKNRRKKARDSSRNRIW